MTPETNTQAGREALAMKLGRHFLHGCDDMTDEGCWTILTPMSRDNALALADIALANTRPHSPTKGVEPVGEAAPMPGSNGGFTMAAFKASDVPVGAKLYTAPQPEPVAGKWVTVTRSALEKLVPDCCLGCEGICGQPYDGDEMCCTLRRALLAAAPQAPDQYAEAGKKVFHSPDSDPVGAAEREVGRYVYMRVEALMSSDEGSAGARELSYLAQIVSDVEEYGADLMEPGDLQPMPHFEAPDSAARDTGAGAFREFKTTVSLLALNVPNEALAYKILGKDGEVNSVSLNALISAARAEGRRTAGGLAWTYGWFDPSAAQDEIAELHAHIRSTISAPSTAADAGKGGVVEARETLESLLKWFENSGSSIYARWDRVPAEERATIIKGARAALASLQAAPSTEGPCLSQDEQKAQAARCACHGSDDYCPCQNAPDRITKATRAAAEGDE